MRPGLTVAAGAWCLVAACAGDPRPEPGRLEAAMPARVQASPTIKPGDVIASPDGQEIGQVTRLVDLRPMLPPMTRASVERHPLARLLQEDSSYPRIEVWLFTQARYSVPHAEVVRDEQSQRWVLTPAALDRLRRFQQDPRRHGDRDPPH